MRDNLIVPVDQDDFERAPRTVAVVLLVAGLLLVGSVLGGAVVVAAYWR